MEWLDFLVRAKSRTYAANGGADALILSDGCKELTYQENAFLYRDRYYGWNPFVGEEVVLLNEKVFWTMNYYGYLLDAVQEVPDGNEVYRILTSALRQVSPEYPYRGPLQWSEGVWKYTSRSQGRLERFEGDEEILWNGQCVYRLAFHGGWVGPAQ